jgi:geranylgeranyl diphosphate synthase, type II
MFKILFEELKGYQIRVEKAIRDHLALLGAPSPLRDACEYALLNGGKRFRPALAMKVADSLGLGADVIFSALAIEFFHTASLIADDLPCMDNDALRREKNALHIEFGEDVALLASYSLISAGYDFLTRNAEVNRNSGSPLSLQADKSCLLAIQNISHNTGVDGAAGGQWIDLHPPMLTKESLHEIFLKKTVTLFETSFVFGWLFGGGNAEKLPLVKKCAYHFGLAFQIADDIEDCDQDKINGRAANWATLFGLDEAQKIFQIEISQFFMIAHQLGLQFALPHKE